jgi:hypothetical protein
MDWLLSGIKLPGATSPLGRLLAFLIPITSP